LERNKTLIKEVRFAEQTCVEMSQQNEALQQQVDGLARQLQHAKRETQRLDEMLLVSHGMCATLESEKAALTRELQEEKQRHKHMLLQQEQLLIELPQQQTTTVVKENVEPNHDNTSSTSRVLAAVKTLPTQLGPNQECNVSHTTSTTELELAKSHAKLAQVSKELQLLRVAESSARRALSRATLEIGILKKRQQTTNVEESNHNNITASVNDSTTVETLQVTVDRLTRECRHRDEAAVEATNQIRALEYELSLAKRQIVVERETLQREFLVMTQSTVANVQRQSELLEDQVSKRTEQFQSKIATLTKYVQHLQDSLDFESETGSTRGSHLEEEAGAADGGSSNDSDRDKMDEGSSEGAVMNATFHPSQSATRSIHEEMLLEQMEEARLVDDAQADTHHLVGHEMFEDLSFISDLSHLYEDLSGLLMHDPTSPTREANANVKVSTLAAKSTTVDASPTRMPEIQIRLESIKRDFMKLKTIVARVVSMAAANGSRVHLNGTIEEQARVVESLERTLGDLVDEAGKNDAERHQLNVEVLQMSKEFNRCQAELKESTAALEETKKAEAALKLEIQMTLAKLEEKECANSVLKDEKERLSLALQQLSESSNHLLQKQKEEKVHQNALAAATEHVEKLQQKVESKSRQLDDSKRQSNDLLSKVETLESNVGKLIEEKSQIQAKYDDASSLLRALSREREQHKQEIDSAKATVLERGRELKVAAETMSAQKEELQKLLTERDAAVDKSDKLSKTVEELTSERNELSSEIQQLKNSVATAKSELEHLKVSYITCNDQLADVSEKNAGKDELVAKIKSSNRAAKEAIATYEQRLSTLNTELEKTQSERSVLQQHLTAMENNLRATAADFVSYKNAMESKLSEQHELIEQVQSTAESLECMYEHKLSSLSMEHETMMDEVKQTINSLMHECRAAYADSLGFLSQIGYEFDGGEHQLLGSWELPWKQSLTAISSHLPQWKQIVQECTHVIDDYQDRLHQAEEKVGDLANTATALKDSEAKMEDKLLVQQHHSETLADKLSTAKMELAKSMREAAELSQTFALTKRELEHVSKQLANQNDLKERTKELISDRQEAEVRVAEMKRAITSLEERLKAAVGES
jgi:predicted  nucleic acid-binding Zn-ribbon protein